MIRKRFVETYQFQNIKKNSQVIVEAFGGNLPDVIYPEIRSITADKVTRNKTYYSKARLIGSEANGSGITSLTYPYKIPVIKDHASGGSIFGGEASPIYGRVNYGRFVEGNPRGYVSVVPAIYNPEAIQNILTECFLTVSIGVETDAANCSVCGMNFASEDCCNHEKGKSYMMSGHLVECYIMMGDIWNRELSFVTVPSDDEAGVINKNLEGIKIAGGESSKKGFLTFGECVQEAESLRKMWSIPSHTSITNIAEAHSPVAAAEKEVMNKTQLALIKDEVYKQEYALFSVDTETVKDVYTSIETSNLMEGQKKELFGRLSKFVADNKVEVEGLELAEASETSDPLIINIDETNYPLLYGYIDALESVKTPEAPVVEESSATEETATETNTQVIEETSTVEETAEIESLNSKVQVLNEKCMEYSGEAHKRLAESVAILAKILRKPTVRGKSLEESISEYTSRTTISLEDNLKDYLLEFSDAGNVDLSSIEKVESPVLQEDNTQTESNPSTETESTTDTTVVEEGSEREEITKAFKVDTTKISNRVKKYINQRG